MVGSSLLRTARHSTVRDPAPQWRMPGQALPMDACDDEAMKIAGTHYRTIWPTAAGAVRVIDQSRLPFELATVDLTTLEEAATAIRSMVVRGAPLIGATAAYGFALA